MEETWDYEPCYGIDYDATDEYLDIDCDDWPTGRRQTYACRDGMCGAYDCERCGDPYYHDDEEGEEEEPFDLADEDCDEPEECP